MPARRLVAVGLQLLRDSHRRDERRRLRFEQHASAAVDHRDGPVGVAAPALGATSVNDTATTEQG